MLNIALDGPVGAGKSTIADEVAKRLGILHLDTGAMYRAVGLSVIENNIPVDDERAVTEFCEKSVFAVKYVSGRQLTYANGEDVTDLIRTPEVSKAASAVSRYAGVRRKMVETQQELARTTPMLLDGRDIGTRVLPDAKIKIYLTASAATRARRRFLELEGKGIVENFSKVLEEVNARDYQDMHRANDPLRQAEDAVKVDSSELTFEETVEKILQIVEEKSHEQ